MDPLLIVFVVKVTDVGEADLASDAVQFANFVDMIALDLPQTLRCVL